MKDLIHELSWRGMLYNMSDGADKQLSSEITTAYLGIDPTADSLHIGHLCGIMMLRHLQKCGHQPIVLIGGATGMIGDPSGKSAERNLLDNNVIQNNVECIKKQLSKFLDFSTVVNSAVVVNNFDWMKDMTFLNFSRDIGKMITVNYMMSKDSVKRRIQGEDGNGMSFTEFTYQLLQGYDFVYLNKNYNCKLQIGGSDQWGNMTTGIDMVKKMNNQEAFAVTCPLITKADGHKFGKTENGNIWLDKKKTSSYQFYQFWLNVNDTDAERYIKIFTDIKEDECIKLINEHKQNPHLRLLQKRLAQDVTIMVHSEKDFIDAKNISDFLFGQTGKNGLENICNLIKDMTSDEIVNAFTGIDGIINVDKAEIYNGINILDLLTSHTSICPSKREARTLLQSNAIRINNTIMSHTDSHTDKSLLICQQCMFVRKGQKKWFLIIAK